VDGSGQEEYVRQVLEAYRKTPGTTGTARRADRTLAAQLYQRGLSVRVIENALVLATARRLMRPAGAAPLGTIRSLAYFLPVIEEVLESVRHSSNICGRSSNATFPQGSFANLSAPYARLWRGCWKSNPNAFGVDNIVCSSTAPYLDPVPSSVLGAGHFSRAQRDVRN
jgi:hypothetical protein